MCTHGACVQGYQRRPLISPQERVNNSMLGIPMADEDVSHRDTIEYVLSCFLNLPEVRAFKSANKAFPVSFCA